MKCTVHRTVRGAPSERWVLFVLKALTRRLRARLRKRKLKCAVVFVGDTRMRTLNRVHRGIDRPTDVLAFPSGAITDELGDVVIAIGVVRRQARRFGVSFKEECARVLVHGALHLLAYDHHTKRDAQKMFPLQEAVVKDILG